MEHYRIYIIRFMWGADEFVSRFYARNEEEAKTGFSVMYRSRGVTKILSITEEWEGYNAQLG